MTATFTNIYNGKPIELEVVGKYTSREAIMRVTSGRTIGRIIRHPGNKYTVEVSFLTIRSNHILPRLDLPVYFPILCFAG
jgi:hypothetical protein